MKTLKSLLFVLSAFALAALVASCAGRAYKQGNWAHSSESADWDIDSAVCFQRSETLTADDREKIEEMKRMNREVADAVNAQAELGSEYGAGSSYASYASGLFGAFVGARNANAEEIYKEQKFTECLEGKGWAK